MESNWIISSLQVQSCNRQRFLWEFSNQLSLHRTGHSFRRGYVHLVFTLGILLHLIMLHGDWKTPSVVLDYVDGLAPALAITLQLRRYCKG